MDVSIERRAVRQGSIPHLRCEQDCSTKFIGAPPVLDRRTRIQHRVTDVGALREVHGLEAIEERSSSHGRATPHRIDPWIGRYCGRTQWHSELEAISHRPMPLHGGVPRTTQTGVDDFSVDPNLVALRPIRDPQRDRTELLRRLADNDLNRAVPWVLGHNVDGETRDPGAYTH